MVTKENLIRDVEYLQNLLVSYATGHPSNDEDYKRIRSVLLSAPELKDRLPRLIYTCRDLPQFWSYIKPKFSTYAERRVHLWSLFGPILGFLEQGPPTPSDAAITETLGTVDSTAVRDAWARALDRRLTDPPGAITAARSLLESVCKYVLDSTETPYEDGADLPRLYRQVSEALRLAPSQQSEAILKQVLGGMTSAVEGLGAMRNKLGDAHGKGKNSSTSELRHAELAVNLAGTTATFLIATYEAQFKDAIPF